MRRDVLEVEKRDYESWDAYFERLKDDDDYEELTWKRVTFDRSQFEGEFDGAVLS